MGGSSFEMFFGNNEIDVILVCKWTIRNPDSGLGWSCMHACGIIMYTLHFNFQYSSTGIGVNNADFFSKQNTPRPNMESIVRMCLLMTVCTFVTGMRIFYCVLSIIGTHCLLILSMLKPWVHSLINCVPLILLGSVGEVEPPSNVNFWPSILLLHDGVPNLVSAC